MKKTIIKCELCPNTREIYTSRLKHGRGRYCSDKCRREAFSKFCIENLTGKPRTEEVKEKLRGENNPNWKGGFKLRSNKSRTYTSTFVKQTPEEAQARKRFRNLTYRVNKTNALGSHTFKEWELLKIYYQNMCLCCKRQEPEITLSEDHVIPLSKGGSNYIENIQPLCVSCNTRKHTFDTDYRKESMGIEFTLNEMFSN